ncbi:hypothetical protein HU200_042415 [Digitaria exilis]|uniref:Cytochrome P450 n=1 Tax=Digitaria exilis TaxID=1010633 RepID=A0A835EET7_9POAL|nr:hypothetical protein HU200_042415 [Digitaria exilis]
MDTLLQLLLISLGTITFVAILRRSTRHAPYSPILPTVKISDPAIAQRLLFDHADAFSNRPTRAFPLDFSGGRYHGISTTPYGPVWRTLRRGLTADILHPTRLSLQEPLQREAVEGLVASLTLGEVVVRHSIRGALYMLMARLCFGDGVDARDVRAMERAQMVFLTTYAEVMAIEGSRLPRILHLRRYLRFDAAFNRLSKIVGTLIVARLHQVSCCDRGGGDGGILPYVDSLLDIQVPDDERVDARRMLTVTEMAPLVWEFIVAGAESVASSVEWALAHLVDQPEVQKKLHREINGAEGLVVREEQLRSMPYLRAVVLECLRMHPPVPFQNREVGAEGAALGGATVPAMASMTTTRFTLMASDIGRNSKAWTEPDEFRPERFLAGGEGEGVGPVPGPKEIKMIPFGAGRRYCPGAGMGMVLIGCVLCALVREFEWAPSGQSAGVDLTELDMFFKVMKKPLRARITPRRR